MFIAIGDELVKASPEQFKSVDKQNTACKSKGKFFPPRSLPPKKNKCEFKNEVCAGKSGRTCDFYIYFEKDNEDPAFQNL